MTRKRKITDKMRELLTENLMTPRTPSHEFCERHLLRESLTQMGRL